MACVHIRKGQGVQMCVTSTLYPISFRLLATLRLLSTVLANPVINQYMLGVRPNGRTQWSDKQHCSFLLLSVMCLAAGTASPTWTIWCDSVKLKHPSNLATFCHGTSIAEILLFTYVIGAHIFTFYESTCVTYKFNFLLVCGWAVYMLAFCIVAV